MCNSVWVLGPCIQFILVESPRGGAPLRAVSRSGGRCFIVCVCVCVCVGGGGGPLILARRAPYYTLGPGVSNPAYSPPSHRPCPEANAFASNYNSTCTLKLQIEAGSHRSRAEPIYVQSADNVVLNSTVHSFRKYGIDAVSSPIVVSGGTLQL